MKVRLAVLAGLLGAGFFFFLPLARGTALYQDKNGFFSFVPPEGWKMEEIGSGYKTTVKFTPRDDNAAIVLIAELDGDNLGSLYLLKKEYVEDHRARFPQGDFRLSRAAIAGFPALKLDFQIGQAVKEEAYIFFFDGVRFDLIYSGRSDDDFTRHYKEAFSSLSTVEPKRRALR